MAFFGERLKAACRVRQAARTEGKSRFLVAWLLGMTTQKGMPIPCVRQAGSAANDGFPSPRLPAQNTLRASRLGGMMTQKRMQIPCVRQAGSAANDGFPSPRLPAQNTLRASRLGGMMTQKGMQIPCVRRSGQGRDYVSLSSRRALSAEAHLGALRMKSRRAASQGTGSFAKRPRERQNRPHKDGISWQARCMPVGSRLVTN